MRQDSWVPQQALILTHAVTLGLDLHFQEWALILGSFLTPPLNSWLPTLGEAVKCSAGLRLGPAFGILSSFQKSFLLPSGMSTTYKPSPQALPEHGLLHGRGRPASWVGGMEEASVAKAE